MNQLAVVSQNQEPIDPKILEQVILGGDLSRLTSMQKVQYYNKVCETVGLNPLTQPFNYLKLNGKEVLYANKGCAEQLRKVHKIGLKVRDGKFQDDLYIVISDSLDPAGRTDSATGVVATAGLRGESLANAMMKAETKSKRRCTLSHCGLNILDESEVEDLSPEALRQKITPGQPTGDDGTPEIEANRAYTFPFGSFKMRTPKNALEVMGPEKMLNALNLIDEKLIMGETYKNVTSEQMIEAKNEIVKVLTAFEKGEINE